MIEFKNVSVIYPGGVKALNDISLNDLLSYGSVIPSQNKKKVVFSAVN